MEQANKVKLGAFILLSALLIILGFLWAGVDRLFAPRYKAMTVIDTSVEGLAIGSPVKCLGLPVGKVTHMAMRSEDGMIAVYFEIFSAALEANRRGGGSTPANISDIVNRRGVSCYLNAANIMGGAYLELAFNKPGAPAPSLLHRYVKPPAGRIYIPSRPSHIGNAIQNISRMLDELQKVDFIEIANKLNQSFDNLNTLVNNQRLTETLDSIHRICKAMEGTTVELQKLLTPENIAKVNRTIDSLDSLQKSSSTENLIEVLRNFNLFLTDARAALTDARQAGRELEGVSKDLRLQFESGLVRFDNTLKQLTRTAEDLGKDPSQFVRGRQEPEVTRK